MPRFAANLRYLFQEVPFDERFELAAKAGFKAVEYQFPYGKDAMDMRDRLTEFGLQFVLLNAPPGDWDAGDRGIAAIPGREREFRESITEAIYYATALACPRIHVMAGLVGENVGREAALATFADNMQFAADACQNVGVRVLVEALNAVDVPGYLLNHTVQARAALAIINRPNVDLQYDLYHGGMSGDDVLEVVRGNLDVIGHIQVAGVPDRREPDRGTIDFFPVFEALDEIGYGGWIGCEYTPENGTVEGLQWASIYGLGRPFHPV